MDNSAQPGTRTPLCNQREEREVAQAIQVKQTGVLRFANRKLLFAMLSVIPIGLYVAIAHKIKPVVNLSGFSLITII